MICEVVGGVWAKSLAIVTDAAHLLTDFASILISLFSLYIATKPPSQRMSFGFHRAEVLGAFFSVFLIWIVTGVLVVLAILRIVNADYEIDATIMAITATIGVLVNLVMGALLYFGGHAHSHGGGDHGHAHPGGIQNETGLERRASLLQEDWAIMDPICTLLFSIIVLCTTLYIMRDAMVVLLEAWSKWRSLTGVLCDRKIPERLKSKIYRAVVRPVAMYGAECWPATKEVETRLSVMETKMLRWMAGVTRMDRIRSDVIRQKFGVAPIADKMREARLRWYGHVLRGKEDSQINGVRKVHDLRIWALTMDKVAVSVHLEVAEPEIAQSVLRKTRSMLKNDYGVHESTVQIEGFVDKDCGRCDVPNAMETEMLRWTADLTCMDRIRNDVILQKFGVVLIADKMREAQPLEDRGKPAALLDGDQLDVMVEADPRQTVREPAQLFGVVGSTNPLKCDRKIGKILEQLKSKIYRAVVRPVAMYGAECWPATREVETRLSVMETKMLRWTE
ncbi:unnamed protein product [Heligmosomoides polygyrus]|uniref:Zinc transporter 1 n=1 Tax=Heligmosomoides polygyrus TaxID=6339 RepID=A0A183FI93_HELPZ|nr:unnamed protein product [Heligmosomoides polygyrus]